MGLRENWPQERGACGASFSSWRSCGPRVYPAIAVRWIAAIGQELTFGSEACMTASGCLQSISAAVSNDRFDPEETLLPGHQHTCAYGYSVNLLLANYNQ